MVRRTGSPTAFWNAVAVGAGGNSNPVEMPRGSEQITIFVTVSAVTNVTIQVAHHGATNADGTEPDHSSPPSTWFPLFYTNIPCLMTFAGAGSQAWIIPDWEVNWVRLSSSGAATITAGYEVTGE